MGFTRNFVRSQSILFPRRFANSSSKQSLTSASWNLLETQKSYQPKLVEDQTVCVPLWNKIVQETTSPNNYTKGKFSMVLPPPNITGDLHLGHALTVAIQDAMCRWNRMNNREVVWVPGLDHAGLATQIVVEQHLFKKQRKTDSAQVNPRLIIGREAFLDEVWQWKEAQKSSILNQLGRLGLTLDWNREYFTFNKEHCKAVDEAMFRLSESGLIYHANSLISWCCHLQSAISDIEVDHKDVSEITWIQIPGYATRQPFGYVDVFDYVLADSSSVNGKSTKWQKKNRKLVPVATTRLETMLADTALAVHPDDSRYSHLIGQKVQHPFAKIRCIPVISDEKHIFPDQGTGVVKVSPGHSLVDWEIAETHQLEVLNMLDDSGCVNDLCGEEFQLANARAILDLRLDYMLTIDLDVNHTAIVCSQFSQVPHKQGMPRFAVRQQLRTRLSDLGLYRGRFAVGESTEYLSKVATISLPICSRSGDVVEPLVRKQWFVSTQSMAEAAVNLVDTGEIRIIPSFHEATWRDWLAPEKRRDWCISRQVWWGHRMPAYRIPPNLASRNSESLYLNDKTVAFVSKTTGNWVIARNPEEARKRIADKLQLPLSDIPSELEQNSDVLDTWFSSGLLPFTALGWPEKTPELSRLYPLDVLETGQDILFFWVARMVMLGYQLTGQPPFKQVFLHGLICDKNGQKMSKSKGNTVDPLQLIEGVGTLKAHQLGTGKIDSLGADAVRASLLATDFTRPVVTYGIESALDYRRFGNKVWQSFRFLSSELSRAGIHVDLGRHSISNAWSFLSMNDPQVPLLDKWILLRVAHLTDNFNSSFSLMCGMEYKKMKPVAFHNCVSDFRAWWTDDLCSVYLEVVKLRLRRTASTDTSGVYGHHPLDVLIFSFLCGLSLLHPIMPHISEVLWQSLPLRKKSEQIHSLLQQSYPHTQSLITSNELDKIPDFVSDVLSSISRVNAWCVLLGLKKWSKRTVGLFISQEQQQFEGQLTAMEELCLVLTGINCQEMYRENTDMMAICCGTGISLVFDPKEIDFVKAENNLQARLAKQIKKANLLKIKLVSQTDDIMSRTETVKLALIEEKIKEMQTQIGNLLRCQEKVSF